jgi:uncharacterized protein with FMN-binding domain
MRQQAVKRAAATAISALAGFGAVLGAHFARSSPKSASLTPVGPARAPQPTSRTTGPTTSVPTKPSRAIGPSTSAAQTGPAVSALGAAEQYGYGVLSVRVTVEGSRIVDVSVANLQTAESYSQMIAQQAIPILRQEVLQAQGVHVYAVSGATYTSEAYLLSVQSALQVLNNRAPTATRSAP